MPSKAFKLAEAMISNPVMSDIVTNTAAVPVSITNQIEISTDQGVATVNDLPNIGNNTGDIQLVESTNRLYVWNGSGWYNIALINTTPAWDSGGQPAGSYVLDADSPQNATIISLAASDPEGLPINYTYVTSGQMDSIATISQDSSVFTITPKTAAQVPDGGTGSITFRASDGINILPQVSSFTLNFISIVTNSKHTSLLATATGTSDNNNITDASTNNHSIAVNGDAHAGTFSPYRDGGYSTYFDHTDRVYLTNDMSAALGTSGFSMEAWIYRTTTDSDENVIVNGPGNDNGWGLAISSGKIRARFHNTNLISGATTVSPNEWHHVMIAKTASNELLIFLDGTLDARSTSSSINYNATSTTLTVGSYADRTQLVSYGFNGYIRDARVIVGYGTFPYGSYGTSVGTNYFTPPSEPLTAVSGTEALLCGLPYHGDLSSNNHSVSETGGAVTKPFSPYDYDEYDAAAHGGSVYFDGTGDWLRTANPLSLSGDFTVSAWVYPQGTSKVQIIASPNLSPNNQFFIDANNAIGTYDGNNTNTAQGVSVVRNAWNYLVWSRTGSTLNMYVNGQQSSNSFSSTNTYNLEYIGILQGANNPLTGHISDLQVKTTSTSAANAVPPTALLSSSGTLLHIKGTDASIIDKSQGSNLKLVGNTTGSTTQVKFADTKSMYFDGIDDHIVGPTVSDLNIGTGDFTAECWIYETTLNTNKGIWDGRSTGSTTDGFTFTRINTDAFRIWSGGALITTDPVTIQNTWVHCAVVRYNGTLTIYINGSSSGTPVSNSTNFSNSGTFIIGAGRHGTDASATAFITGYIQDFRVSNYARYTANFTPPTASLEG